MATQFLMPKLGLTMEEGTIVEWLVEPGDEVSAGAAVLRIETDKTETEVEAAASGHLHPTAAVGDTFACGEVIGWFLTEGEEVPGAGGSATPASSPGDDRPESEVAAAGASPGAAAANGTAPTRPPGGRLFASPNARRIAAERGIDLARVIGTGPNGRIVSEDLQGIDPDAAAPVAPRPGVAATSATAAASAPAAGGAPPSSPVPATAAARQLADLLGVDLAAVAADPGDGRVSREAVARHVRELLASLAAAPDASRPAPQLPALQPPTEVVPLRGMRGTIAKRMHESLQQMAQLSLFMDADLDAAVAHREARKSAGEAVPSYTDYVIAAVARALRAHPRVNSQITDDGVALLPDVHVGMAVALDEGLIVPVVRDPLERSLESLSVETSRLAEAARAGSLALADLEGGTFSVSTLGMFGVDGFTPVINPPNTAILGVGRLRDDVVVDDGAVSTVRRLTLSLTWDHRAFDGAPAAEFCRSICDALQDPETLDRPA